MTVHARRYGRWCREHFDVVAAERLPAPRPGEPVKGVPEPEAEPVKPGPEQPRR